MRLSDTAQDRKDSSPKVGTACLQLFKVNHLLFCINSSYLRTCVHKDLVGKENLHSEARFYALAFTCVNTHAPCDDPENSELRVTHEEMEFGELFIGTSPKG